MASSTATQSNGAANGHAADVNLDAYDPEQVALMEERLIVLDVDDNPIGEDSKKTCKSPGRPSLLSTSLTLYPLGTAGHLMSNILPPKSMLHRAFSCFLFRPSDGKLLLQKRASEKITFPDLWTNTCCSHPLSVPGEIEPKEQLGTLAARLSWIEV